MDILKRSLAPITDQAWEAIDQRASSVLKGLLSARRVADVDGPHGWNYHATPLGKLADVGEGPVKGAPFGLRAVMPLLEARIPFSLPTWELDDISRGDKMTDFTALDEAAATLARFEDEVVYNGLENAGVAGLLECSDNETVELEDINQLMSALVDAVNTLRSRHVEGPYALLCDTELWKKIVADNSDYPLTKRLAEVLELKLIPSPQVDVSALISLRGGDFEIVLGQDVAVGFESASKDEIRFFFTESFTFKVLTPEAVVPFHMA